MIKQTSLVILAIGSLAQTSFAMNNSREENISPDLFEVPANPNGKIKLAPEIYEAVRQMAIAGIMRLKQEERRTNETRTNKPSPQKRTTVIVTFSQPTYKPHGANPASHRQKAPMGRKQKKALRGHNKAMLRLINKAIAEKAKEIEAFLDSENK